MTTATETPLLEPVIDAPEDKSLPPDPDKILVPKLDERFALTRSQLLLTVGVALFFMYYNYMKLFHSDFWGHVAYGKWMVEHGVLPTEEMFVPLAQGMPLTCTAWLSQVLLGFVERASNVELFSTLFAATVLCTHLTLSATFFRQTKHLGISLLGALLAWFFTWSRHAVIRPEIFGSLCFAMLFWMTVRSDSACERVAGQKPEPMSRLGFAGYLVGVGVLFALWANLHGSFIVGFLLLGAYVAGRVVEVLWEKRDIQAVLSDKLVQQRLIAAEVAVLGTLLNPYGMDLLIHTVAFSGNPNLKDVWEWFPLEMWSLEGPFMLISWVFLVVLMRHSRRRVSASDVFLMFGFTLATCLRVRMIQWYGPALMLALVPHLYDIGSRVLSWLEQGELRGVFDWLRVRSFRHTLVTGLAVWIIFCFSPASIQVLGGKPRQEKHVYSKDTPRGVTEYLRKNPPVGMVAGPQWWGDWLVYDGPPDLKVLMTTNSVHVVPSRVWKDYLAIARGEPGLEDRLDRYRCNTLVICKELQRDLRRTADQLEGWENVFEDDVGLVLSRKVPARETKTEEPPKT